MTGREPRDADRWSTVSSRRVYSGRVLNLDIDTVRFPNGNSGELEIIRHPGASAVVPCLDPLTASDPRILLIRQFRYAAGGYLYEIPAGRLDANEEPDACARRELTEETGYMASSLTPLGGFFTTPGFIDEYIHLFLAEGLSPGVASPERDEFISVETHSLADALDMVDRRMIIDAKTVVSLVLAARKRQHTHSR